MQGKLSSGVLVLALLLASCRTSVSEGDAAPALTGVVGLDGRLVGDLPDPPYFVLFWASWWAPCVGHLPFVQELYEHLHPLGFEFISVALDTEESFRAAVQAHPAPYPQARDPDGVVSARWWGGGWALEFVLVGADGRVVWHSFDFPPADWLRTRLGYASEDSDRSMTGGSAAALLRAGYPLAAADAFLEGRPGDDLREAVDQSRLLLEHWRSMTRNLARSAALIPRFMSASDQMRSEMWRDMEMAVGVAVDPEGGIRRLTGIVLGGYPVLSREASEFSSMQLRRHLAIASMLESSVLPEHLDDLVAQELGMDRAAWEAKYTP